MSRTSLDDELDRELGVVLHDPSKLTREQLENLVRELQVLLYLDHDSNDNTFWNPEKELDHQMLDAISAFMRQFGVAPTKG